MSQRSVLFALLGVLPALVACGPSPSSAQLPTTPALAAAHTTFGEQAKAGQALYGEHCAGCHGDGGEGTAKAPRVVGMAQGALPLDPPATAKGRKTQFHTAADVAGFVVANMPPGGDSELSESGYWSIMAFDLKANGVELAHPIDASNASEVVLHP